MPGEAGPQLDQINEKRDRIIRLLALKSVPPDGTMKEKAILLNTVGLAPKEIAELLGTTPNTVSVALSAARRSRKQRKVGTE